MKNLSLAVVCFAFTACGNTPKNEVTKTIPAPQQDQSQAQFVSNCLREEGKWGSGVLIAGKTICRRPVNGVAFGRANDMDYEQAKEFEEVTLGANLGPGAVIYGSFDSTTLPPEITLDGEPIARGNILDPLITDRAGTLRIRTFKGAYKSLNYVLSTCSSRTSVSVPCTAN